MCLVYWNYGNILKIFKEQMPYDLNTDTFIKCPQSKVLSESVGGVVFTKSNKRKPIKFLYSSIVRFLDTLNGNVLIIGDPNCVINTRCGWKHWSTPVSECFSVLEYQYSDDHSDRMIEYSALESFLQRQSIDHFVYCFSGNRVLDYDCKAHYLSLIAGTNGITSCTTTGQFYLKGKLLDLSAFPRGNLVNHVLLCGDSCPYDSNMVWYTDISKVRKTCSLIPLSSSDKIGPVEDILVSDKLDGKPIFLTVMDGRANFEFPNDGGLLHKDFGITNWSDQVLVCEIVDRRIFVCEPLVHNEILFGEWVKNVMIMPFDIMTDNGPYTVMKKIWTSFPLDAQWERFAASGEGIVIKNRNCVIGQYSMRYSKLETYYLKLPDRVSYEDNVEVKNDRLVGIHGNYTDPLKLYAGPGIYEINMKTLTLYKQRDKYFADPYWYVQALLNPPKFKIVESKKSVESSIFKYNVSECEYSESDGGVIRLKNVRTEVKPGSLQELKGTNHIIVSIPHTRTLTIGSHIKYQDRKYIVYKCEKGSIFAKLKYKRKKIRSKVT